MESPGPRREGFLAAAAGAAAAVHKAVFGDGVLAAAGRQGLSELGEALKAFPDSIQVHEVGTIFSPTQGEIAEGRRDSSPSDIARDPSIAGTATTLDRDRALDQGRGR